MVEQFGYFHPGSDPDIILRINSVYIVCGLLAGDLPHEAQITVR